MNEGTRVSHVKSVCYIRLKDPHPQQLFRFSVIDKRIPSAMAMSEEVEDFKKRVQELLNEQQKNTVKKFMGVMPTIQWAVAADSFD